MRSKDAINLQAFELRLRKDLSTRGCTPVEVTMRALSLLASASSSVAVSAWAASAFFLAASSSPAG